MRSAWLYPVLTIALLVVNCPGTAGRRWAILPRADASSSIPPAGPKETAKETSKAAASSAAAKTGSVASLTSSHSSSSATAKGTAAANGTSSTDGASAATSGFVGITAAPIPKGSLNVTSSNTTHIEGLPIKPSVTPAMSVAGAILIVTGALYAIIGIKTKWLHVYLSTAYIFALAVTILIVYVMHPPVPNGIQGAYFVAACVTGLIAGGVAVTFPDVTEGLGCFIGGFCLSMWFLVLRSGGLISSTAGKIIFIACFTIGSFGFYISHYTRPYGLIASTSVAGATAIVVGTDCFSRAGLKEFWLYIWNLNDSTFPPHYRDPYPITRGIRVEIAAIVIISLIGMLSQMKIWQIVKQKKELRAAVQREKERERDLSDEEQGRKVEDQNLQDRPLWEAVHGTKSKSSVKEQYLDSALGTSEPGTTRKNSSSEVEGMEMEDLKSQNGSSTRGRVTVHVAQDDFENFPVTGGDRSVHSVRTISDDGRTQGGRTVRSETSSVRARPQDSKVTLDPNLTLRPSVVPPPFRIPEQDLTNDDDDGSSVAASAASERLPDPPSKRLSGSGIIRKLSQRSRRSYVANSSSEEALVVPHVDDEDKASSQAATFDGLSDKNASDDSINLSARPTATLNRNDSQASLSALADAAHDTHNVSTRSESVHPAEAVPLPDSPPASIVETHSVPEQPYVETRPETAHVPKTSGEHEPRATLAAENLPGGASKIVTAYRTNEWAKYLDRADAPEVEELKANKARAQPIPSSEAPAPLNVRDLQQTPLNAEPAPAVVPTATVPSVNKSRSTSFLNRNPFSKKSDSSTLQPLAIAKQASRNASQTSLTPTVSRNASQTSLNSTSSQNNQRPSLPNSRSPQPSPLPLRNNRSSSGPLGSPLAESPIDEDKETSFPARFTPQSTHLMSQRNRIISARPSSTSLLRSNSATVTSPYRSTEALLEDAEEDIPLSKRKSLLQQQRPQRSSTNPSGSSALRLSSGASTPYRSRSGSGANTPINNLSSTRLSAASPGPNPSLYPMRPGPSQRESTISTWRASLAPNTTATYQNQEMERRRSELLAEKKVERGMREEEKTKDVIRGSVVDRGMRRGDMLSAHREAMRKMQEGAKM